MTNIEMEFTEDSVICKTTKSMYTQILDTQEKETLKAIVNYCEENGIIPNIIDKNKLDLILKLGIQALVEREMEAKNNDI